jgi:hypothetical protein
MTLAAFLVFAVLSLRAAVSPITAPLVCVALLAVALTKKTVWNTRIARIFSLDRIRSDDISQKTVIDRSFGGLPGLKFALQ